MSNLVNDFLIEPVLRRARNFSRSNAQCESIQSQQITTSLDHDVATIKDSTDQSDIEKLSRIHITGDSDSDAINTSEPLIVTHEVAREDEGLEGIFDDGEDDALSGAPRLSLDINSSPGDTSLSTSQHEGHVEPDDFSTNGPSTLSINTSASTNLDSMEDNIESDVVDINRLNSTEFDVVEESSQDVDHSRPTSLPENDGMGHIRRQILSIQAMDIRPEQKARLMHQLLTRNYSKAQKKSNARKQRKLLSPSTVIKQKRSPASGSLASFLWPLNGSLDSSNEEQNYTYRLSPDDLKQTFVPLETEEAEDYADFGSKDEGRILGCKHYERNVKLQCSACEKWYTCRLCHDEVEDHILDRKATKNMLCMICGCAQEAGEFCVECSERTAWYYCNVCKLWDNDSSKSIYHCHDCGICRKGLGIGKDFFHCKTCDTCMSMSVEHSHKCIERVSDCDCPICGEYMFTSPTPVVFMICGHGIHKACYEEHLKTSYKCPICSKSTINMEAQFRNLDLAVASQPMPPQFQDTKAMVSCNDCCAKSAVKYHWLGLKCAICDSYNTAQLSILSDSTGATNHQVASSNTNPQTNINASEPPTSLLSGPNAARLRRHSTYINQDDSNERGNNRLLPPQRLYRTSRSVSRTWGVGLSDEEVSQAIETDESAGEEDELDFWGLDEPRSVTSGENVEEIEEDESDDDSILEDCDDDDGEDEEDEFALFGHR